MNIDPSENQLALNRLLALMDKGESWLLALLLTTMIGLACLQIALRTFFSSGLLWAEPLLRYLVLWCGLLGAVSATGQGRHIALDLLGKFVPVRLEPLVRVITDCYCLLISSWLTWAAIGFLEEEIHYGGAGPLGLPLWCWNLIFPLAFGLIGGKYLLLFFGSCRQLLSGIPK